MFGYIYGKSLLTEMESGKLTRMIVTIKDPLAKCHLYIDPQHILWEGDLQILLKLLKRKYGKHLINRESNEEILG